MQNFTLEIIKRSAKFINFINTSNKAPILDLEEERDLIKTVKDTKDIYAAQQLIFSNQRLVSEIIIRIIEKLNGTDLLATAEFPLEKMLDTGNSALTAAIFKFDLTDNTRISEYAKPTIITSILNLVLKNGTKNEKIYDGATLEIFTQEGIEYEQYITKLIKNTIYYRKNMDDYTEEEFSKVPFITHQVYLTSQFESSITNSINTSKKLNKIDDFEHYIWTDNKGCATKPIDQSCIIPAELISLKGSKVHLISEFQTNKLYPYLLDAISQGLQDKTQYITASNLVSLMAVYKYGGLYHSLDYYIVAKEIYEIEKIAQYFRAFNFFGGNENLDTITFIGNAFFGASPKHLIIEDAMARAHINLSPNAIKPDYVNHAANPLIKVIYETGAAPLTMAYAKKANIKGNLDIVEFRNVFFNAEYAWLQSTSSKCVYSPDNALPALVSQEYGQTIVTLAGQPFCDNIESEV